MKKKYNFIRRYRMRTGFSQQDVAYLVGHRHAASISLYERAHREPKDLETAFCLALSLNQDIRELFPSIFQRSKQLVENRAWELAQELPGNNENAMARSKRHTLQGLIGEVSTPSTQTA